MSEEAGKGIAVRAIWGYASARSSPWCAAHGESTPHSAGYYLNTATYWPNGNVNVLWLSGTIAATYNADGEGRATAVTASGPGQQPVSAVSYNTSSQATAVTYGSADTDSFVYDPNTGRLQQHTATVNGSSLTGVLTWNANGTLQKLAMTDAFNAANTQTCTQIYDDWTRLKSVDCGSGKWGQTFDYGSGSAAEFGNVSKSAMSGHTGTTYVPTFSATTNRMTSLPAGSPVYDANGSLTSDGAVGISGHAYAWDVEGKLTQLDSGAAAVTFTYDALGRRVEQIYGGVSTGIVYSPLGWKMALMTKYQVLQKGFFPLPGGGTAVANGNGVIYYRHPDWLGSSRLSSTPTRTVYSDTSYAPFGETETELGTRDRNFTGQDQDAALDLYDFPYREYHSSQSRWITPDPAGLNAVDPANPQSWNRYGYVLNNPLANIDPLGLHDDCGGTCSDFSFPVGECTVFVSYYEDDLGYDEPIFSAVCPTNTAASSGGGAGGPSLKAGSKGTPAAPKSGTSQTFNACMAAHANDFSILGTVNAGTNALFNRQDRYKNNLILGALGGNSITSLLYGSTADAAGTGVTLAPTVVTAAMGTVTTYGRRTSTIMALNIAGKGGQPFALGASSVGTKAALTTAGKWLGLGLDFEVKLGIDAGFAAAEAAYCYSQAQ